MFRSKKPSKKNPSNVTMMTIVIAAVLKKTSQQPKLHLLKVHKNKPQLQPHKNKPQLQPHKNQPENLVKHSNQANQQTSIVTKITKLQLLMTRPLVVFLLSKDVMQHVSTANQVDVVVLETNLVHFSMLMSRKLVLTNCSTLTL